jgi:hypothetical protein
MYSYFSETCVNVKKHNARSDRQFFGGEKRNRKRVSLFIPNLLDLSAWSVINYRQNPYGNKMLTQEAFDCLLNIVA